MAILLVLARHGARPFVDSQEGLLRIFGWDLAGPLLNGWLGVDLFFVLSGFLISGSLMRHTSVGGGALDFKLYFAKRVLRIFPAYYTVLLIAAAGLVQIGRRRPLIAVGMAAALVSQVVAILTLAPVGQSSAWARYFTLVWPLLLVLVAAGAKMGIDAAVHSNLRAKQFATVATLAAIAIAVPAMSPIALFNSPQTSFRSAKTMLKPSTLPCNVRFSPNCDRYTSNSRRSSRCAGRPLIARSGSTGS